MFYILCSGEKEWKLQPELILSPRCRNILYVCAMYKTMFKRIGEVYTQDGNPSLYTVFAGYVPYFEPFTFKICYVRIISIPNFIAL